MSVRPGVDGAVDGAVDPARPRAVYEPPPATHGVLDIPRDTTPTWEIELLISGIVLVGLVQIPPWLRELWQHRAPHASVLGAAAGGSALLAVDAALYALVGCFLVHLALRGYWVALVGADSVFPHGVRWDKQREYGPIQAEITQARVRPLRSFIARADNAASLVFATGFVLAASAVSSLGFVVALGAVGWALSAVLPVKLARTVFVAVLGVLAVAVFGAAAVDVRFGARLRTGGRMDRSVRAVLRAVSGLTPDGVRSLAAVLTSNLDKRVAYGAALVGLGGAYVSAQLSVRDDDVPGASNYTYFAEDPRPGVVTADYYDALRRDGGGTSGAPSIQSDVVTDPYVRLFVPYRPERHDAALRRACPGLRPPPAGRDEGPGAATADDAVLACAAKLHAVTLDGRPLPDGRFRFFTNPRTERRGFLMLIPAAGLAPGEHVLAVQPARRDPAPADTAPVRIPFWR